jgi:ubiquinone/menaquinone biosynthesis C-methylase UbiE
MLSVSILSTLFKEYASEPKMRRIPEPELIMDSEVNVDAFDKAGTPFGPMAPTYLFITSHVSQVIAGCKNVLDLGCGSGQLISRIAQANSETQFTGIDLSSNMLGRAEQNLRQAKVNNVNLQTQDMTNLKDFANQSFDAVISSLAFHHLPDEKSLESCFKEIQRVLKANGKIFLFDMCLVKKLETVDNLLRRSMEGQPKAFVEDSVNSFKAAFPFEFYRELAQAYLPCNIELRTTFLCSFLGLMRTPAGHLTENQKKQFQSVYKSLSPVNRAVYKDIVSVFALKGLTSPIK